MDEQKINDVDKNDNSKICSVEIKKSSNKSKSAQTSKQTFFDTIGSKLNKYWKMGIHWLSALRCLLAEHFDAKAIMILNTS